MTLRVLPPVLLAACSVPGPPPEEVAAELPSLEPLSPEESVRVWERITAGAEAMEGEDFAAAEEAARAALGLDPRSVPARLLLARALAARARLESPADLDPWREAEGHLRLAASLAPGDPEVALAQARFLEAEGHLSAAVSILDGVVSESAADDPELLAAASRLHYELGEERAALPLLERLLAVRPDDDGARYRLAQVRLQMARTRLAEEGAAPARQAFLAAADSFERYAEHVPDDAAGPAGAGYGLLQAWRLEPEPSLLARATGHFRRAEALDAVSPERPFDVGVALDAAGASEAASEAYERALARDPEHLPALLNLAANLLEQGRADEARPYYELALRLPLQRRERRAIERWLEENGGPPRR